MKTVSDNLREQASNIKTLLDELLTHSSIHRWNNNDNSSVIWIGGDYAWSPLDEEGRRIQSKLLEEYRHLYSILQTLLRHQPDDTLKTLKEADVEILKAIQQKSFSFGGRAKDYFDAASEYLNSQVELISRLYDSSSGVASFVPDTNALLFNPALDKWEFDSVSQFVIVLTPPVLSELDSLKMNHRVESVREKSEKVIRLVKECRRRGKLKEGVPLVRGISEIIAVATEPDIANSLPWLDPHNNDDRLLAATIEVMRVRPRSPVVLISRDINLQNKAEFAGVPFIEPPDPK